MKKAEIYKSHNGYFIVIKKVGKSHSVVYQGNKDWKINDHFSNRVVNSYYKNAGVLSRWKMLLLRLGILTINVK